MTATSTEASAMRRAIALSALGLGTTSPNPPVGCVILDPAGRPAGEGYHQRKGQPHAEVNALAAAGANTRGGTAVVTLEPCNHHGRTPPCHQALIDAGIARVLISLIDPTSRGLGGAARLREAGLDVEVGLLADEARVVLGPWLDALQAARPRVVWACDITDGGPRMLADDVFARAGLRCQVDAVIYGDGRVEEGLRHAHGEGAFSLPSSVPVTEPSTALSALYGGGARRVLLHCGPDPASRFIDLQVVDEAVMLLAAGSSSRIPRLAGEPSTEPLAGFSIRRATRLESGVLLEASAPWLPQNPTV